MWEGKRRAIVVVSPAGHPGIPKRGLHGGGGAWRAAWLFVYLSCLFEMDVFDEEETSAVQSLMSGTYITV